ncbi:tyrosine-protein phosphatase non-receptor type 13 isoform X6 [Cryptotermes secundus]|uniref:tyrosine-protein phosphatase non-receptor type 13 isoform X6 n=1 Tax=Cryptotermes secundus TaxID=105785 RepID=UPI001454CAD5|nr:tyrosine-protein phosphatase non-receptor type 13 isoform X6 [Cryptotermes secundus]
MRRPLSTFHMNSSDHLLEINGHPLSSYEDATELLKRSSDVVHLKFLHNRHSNSHRKGRHDPSSGNSASSRRPKRRHQRQNLSSLNIDSGMGSNVSRHSEKGLTGRRAQSHGNLCNGNKILAPSVGRILVPCSGGVGPKDRNKFCGSLPNHLDTKHGDVEDPCRNGNNNNGEHAIPNNCNEVELRLRPLPSSCTLDPASLHDQGYGSERSPEEEHPPSLPGLLELTSKYPFITREATFEVCLLKGGRGLGLSVTGGVDAGEQWPGLIRIKRLFPHQPASQTGQLRQGDILLAANGVPLIGLTNYQALEVLRKTPNNVVLTVCRPPSDVFCTQAPSEPPPPPPPPPPRRDPAHNISYSSHHILPLPPLQTEGPCGEFDIVLTKVNRSLGFTLRKEDESVLGHYVRALVRDPALSDGRIRPGDKIVAVNDVDISPMSHEEAVMFLRQCGDQVKLRLYRDAAQTPVSALSPAEEVKVFKPKPLLRKEAIDMLSDLAVKKLSPCDSSSSSYSRLRRVSDGQSSSPCSSPRRRQLVKTPSPDVHAATSDKLGQKYIVTSHVGDSDSSGEQSRTSMDSTKGRGNASSFAYTTGSGDSIDMKPQRPNFLDLCAGNTTPGSSRKQKFTFSVAATGGNEWDSLAPTSESDELATNTTLGSVSQYYPTTSNSSDEFRTDCVDDSGPNYDSNLPTEPASMPPLTNLSSTSSTSTAFSYRNPAYQSAHPSCYMSNSQNSMRKSLEDTTEHASDQDIPGKLSKHQTGSGGEGSRGLLKWKGIVFTPENDAVEERENSNITPCPEDSSSQLAMDKENEQGDQVFMVELTRGWNSRLGFSLQGDGHHTYISAIYADSVAAKDGRLQAGDQVLMVNDENVEDMSTAEVIDLLRKIRGTIGITVLRKSGPHLQSS